MLKKIATIICLALFCMLGVGVLTSDTHATVSSADILKKWTFAGYRQCVLNGMLETPIDSQKSGLVANSVEKKKEGTIYLPSYSFGHSANKGSVNCYQLFHGVNGLSGVTSYIDGGDAKWSDPTATNTFLVDNLKYTFEPSAGSKYFNINATVKSTVALMGNNSWDTVVNEARVEEIGNNKYKVNASISGLNVNTNNSELKISLNNGIGCTYNHGDGKYPVVVSFGNDGLEGFADRVEDALRGIKWSVTCNNATSEYSFSRGSVVAGQGGTYTYNKNVTDSAIGGMIGTNGANLTLNKNERFVLYTNYLEKAVAEKNGEIDCSDEPGNGSNYTSVKLKSGNVIKSCSVSFNGAKPGDIGPVYTLKKGEGIVSRNMQQVINWLNDNADSVDLNEVLAVNHGDGDGGDTAVKENCMSSRAGESIGWILCPILTFLSNAADNAYSNYVEPALQVDPVLFQERSGNKNDARDAWGVFQGIANTLFIILLIVVIFSQLTGVGIDNYGIKKILPKLIVAAVLINLSYLICIICVDLSNILGNAFQALFNGLSESFRNNIPSDLGINSLGDVASSIGTTAITGLVILAILAAEIWPVVQDGGGPAVLLALLVAALSVAVAIFFLFLLLAVREAAIVVLTVISPVAFACFILPNTKKLFDRWLKFGWQLLLVYPICGLLIGGGNFVSALTLSVGAGQGGFFAAFMAIVVGVVPIFFIPSVLRSSFAAAGNIGAKLSGVGQRLGKRMGGNLDRGVKGTNRWKSYQTAREGRRQEGYARRTMESLGRRQARGHNLTAREQERLRKAQDVMLARRKERMENDQRTQGGYYDAMSNKQDLAIEAEADAITRMNDPTVLAAERQSMADEARLKRDKARAALIMGQTQGQGLEQLMGRWNTVFDNGDEDDVRALTSVISQRYGKSGASAIANSLNNKVGVAGNINYQNSLRALQQTMNDNSGFAGNMKAGSPDAYQMISDAGMRFDQSLNGGSGGMAYEDMGYFTQHNNTATKVSDWASATGATLQRAIDAGEDGISTDTIERLLNSTDPSVVSGLQSEAGKREMLEAALYNRQHNPSGVGPNLDNRTASANYRRGIQQQRDDNELYIRHEEDAVRRGMTNINIPASVNASGIMTPGTTIQGYAVPNGFNTGGNAPIRNTNGDYIYTDVTTGRRWNANTGRYVN